MILECPRHEEDSLGDEKDPRLRDRGVGDLRAGAGVHRARRIGERCKMY